MEYLNINDKYLREVTSGLLKLIAQTKPDLFEEIVDKLVNTPRDREIILLRYKSQTKFELIPELLSSPCTLRTVFKVHRKFIDNIILYILSKGVESHIK